MKQGTISRGLKAPIIKKGDDLAKIVVSVLEENIKEKNFELNNRDVLCITEAIVAKAAGNYATIQDIANDINKKFSKGKKLGVLYPITSRNRFGTILKAIKLAKNDLVVQLSFPGDEVGNKIVDEDEFYNSNHTVGEVFTKEQFKKEFKNTKHIFTGVDYLDYYQEIIGENSRIILSNDPRSILDYVDEVLVCSIHTRDRNKRVLLNSGAKKVLTLAEILNEKTSEHGYNELYGVLGSNLAKENSLKLFPNNAEELCYKIQKMIEEKFNKHLEVMVYGDGAFKDPKGGIWELADPLVSPGFTSGLLGTPTEIKIKYIADNKYSDLKGDELINHIKEEIKNKGSNLVGQNISLGTTPRQYPDLLGSLADLTSGSGDKGTPIVLIQNYFTNYAD